MTVQLSFAPRGILSRTLGIAGGHEVGGLFLHYKAGLRFGVVACRANSTSQVMQHRSGRDLSLLLETFILLADNNCEG